MSEMSELRLQMSELRSQVQESRETLADHDLALRGPTDKPHEGLASIVRETVIVLYGDEKTSRTGLVNRNNATKDRVDAIEQRERERKQWLAGAVFVAGSVGGLIGFGLKFLLAHH